LTKNDSPENLRKFLESDDPAMVRMGISMAKRIDLTEENLGIILGLKLWSEEPEVRKAATIILKEDAPKLLEKTKNWKNTYRMNDLDKLMDIIEELNASGIQNAVPVTHLIKALGDGGRYDGLQLHISPIAKRALAVFEELNKVGDRRTMIPLIKALGDIPAYHRSNQLLAHLSRHDNHLRRNAVIALGNFGDVQAVEPLIEELKGHKQMINWRGLDKRFSGHDIRVASAVALGKLGDARAVEYLIEALGDENGYVRGAAARALGEIGDERAVGPLIKALEYVNAHVFGTQEIRHQGNIKVSFTTGWNGVWEALDMFKWEPDTDELRAIYLLVKGDIEALSEWGEPAVEPLVKAFRKVYIRDHLRHREPYMHPAVKALGKIGVPAVESLITMLEDESVGLRQEVVDELGEIGDTRAVEPLTKALKDEDEWIPGRAADALGKIGDARAVEPLIKALGDDEGRVRSSAARALGKIVDVRAIEPLIELFDDDDYSVRSSAARALGEIGDTRAVEPLIKALEDNNEHVRTSVVWVLGTFDDDRVVEPLIKALGDENWWVRRDASGVLGELGDARAVEPLIKLIEYEEGQSPHLLQHQVRDAAKEALVKITENHLKGKEKDNIIKFLESNDPGMVRMGASMLKGILEE